MENYPTDFSIIIFIFIPLLAILGVFFYFVLEWKDAERKRTRKLDEFFKRLHIGTNEEDYVYSSAAIKSAMYLPLSECVICSDSMCIAKLIQFVSTLSEHEFHQNTARSLIIIPGLIRSDDNGEHIGIDFFVEQNTIYTWGYRILDRNGSYKRQLYMIGELGDKVVMEAIQFLKCRDVTLEEIKSLISSRH